MNLLIRPVRLSDAENINEMRQQIEVRTNTLTLATETISFTEAFLKNMGTDDHILVAETEGKVVGMIGLHIFKSARQRHLASLGMTIRGNIRKRVLEKS
jgi:putative acetyltransferase